MQPKHPSSAQCIKGSICQRGAQQIVLLVAFKPTFRRVPLNETPISTSVFGTAHQTLSVCCVDARKAANETLLAQTREVRSCWMNKRHPKPLRLAFVCVQTDTGHVSESSRDTRTKRGTVIEQVWQLVLTCQRNSGHERSLGILGGRCLGLCLFLWITDLSRKALALPWGARERAALCGENGQGRAWRHVFGSLQSATKLRRERNLSIARLLIYWIHIRTYHCRAHLYGIVSK